MSGISATANFEGHLKPSFEQQSGWLCRDTSSNSKLSSIIQVSGKPFTLETLDRKTVPFDEEIREPCVWLRCVPALDRCQRWSWRIREGKIELRE